MTVGDGVGGAGLNAVAAEDAAIVVDVVDLGVALGGGDANFVGVFRSLNIDAICGAGRGAKEAGDAFLQAIFVALQARARRESAARRPLRAGGPCRRDSSLPVWAWHLPKGDAHAFGDGGDDCAQST